MIQSWIIVIRNLPYLWRRRAYARAKHVILQILLTKKQLEHNQEGKCRHSTRTKTIVKNHH